MEKKMFHRDLIYEKSETAEKKYVEEFFADFNSIQIQKTFS
jgi:hypothetical protein